MISLEAGVAGLTSAGFVLSVCGIILAVLFRYGAKIRGSKLAVYVGLSSFSKLDGAVLCIAMGFFMQIGAIFILYYR